MHRYVAFAQQIGVSTRTTVKFSDTRDELNHTSLVRSDAARPTLRVINTRVVVRNIETCITIADCDARA